MSNAQSAAEERAWRSAHGPIFLVLFGLVSLFPPSRQWPWLWLGPLTGYTILLAGVPQLRRTAYRPRIGELTRGTVIATLSSAVLSVVILVGYQVVLQPDVSASGAALPVDALGGWAICALLFPIHNASLEELIFRGILFDAIEAEWGCLVAVVGTAVFFGYGHLHGYPPGWTGACLAGVYALLLGFLRIQSAGLLLPILAHIVADATIFAVLTHANAF
jgi:membrane protease YdiL (CAAX protease family)